MRLEYGPGGYCVSYMSNDELTTLIEAVKFQLFTDYHDMDTFESRGAPAEHINKRIERLRNALVGLGVEV